MKPHGQAAVLLLLQQLVGAAVPDLDGAGPVLPFRDLPLERRVLERVVFDVNGEVLLTGLEGDALRNRPAEQGAVLLEPEVVVQPPGVVTLDDEDRLLRLSLLRTEGLRRLLGIAFALVLGELLGHVLGSFTPRGPLALLLRAFDGLAQRLHQVDHLALRLLLGLRQRLALRPSP